MNSRLVVQIVCAFTAALILTPMPARAAEQTGLVLMHGKLGAPGATPLGELVPHLESGGILVETPEMPWSRDRQYGAGYEQALTEIDAAVARLRARGATRIVIGGHSMGAAAALVYGARKPAHGLLLLAPGHHPQSTSLQERYAGSVARARQQVDTGKGDDRDTFEDFDASKKPPVFNISTTARSYLSYFDPQGIANTLKSAAALPAGTPVLWVDGSRENPGLKSYGQKVYAAMATSAKKSIEVDAGHLNTPGAAREQVLVWLKGL